MTLRRLIALLIVALSAAGPAAAATFTTANFVVTAPDPNLARRFGQEAEKFRVEKALEWLGQEMPPWPQRCPIVVKVNEQSRGGGGATSFTFGYDANRRPVVTSQEMEIHGPSRQLLQSVLPHEITHTVLAHYFGRPVPRWADEGGSVLSENDEERFEHDVKNRQYLNEGRGIMLKILFPMGEYPRDMHVLYAQGYSVCAYLVDQGGGGQAGRAKLLQFLAIGMQGGQPGMHGNVASWNAAVRQVYRIDSVDALEAAWLDDLKSPQPRVAARSGGGSRTASGSPTSAAKNTGPAYVSSIRSSAPPAVPLLDPPMPRARGSMPETEPARSPSPWRNGVPGSPITGRPLPAQLGRPIPLLDPPEIPASINR